MINTVIDLKHGEINLPIRTSPSVIRNNGHISVSYLNASVFSNIIEHQRYPQLIGDAVMAMS